MAIPLWRDPQLIADSDRDYGFGQRRGAAICRGIGAEVGGGSEAVIAAYEDPLAYLMKERQLPVNVDPLDNKLDDPEERERLRRVFERGLGKPAGFVLPLLRVQGKSGPSGRGACGCSAPGICF